MSEKMESAQAGVNGEDAQGGTTHTDQNTPNDGVGQGVSQRVRDAFKYIDAGIPLVPLRPGEKGTNESGWNKRENCIFTRADATRRLTADSNFGAALAYADPPMASLDIDDEPKARDWLAERGIDLNALLNAPDAVRIHSDRQGKAKLLYRLQEPMPSCVVKDNAKTTILEFRCASREGLTFQDVLPPSIHPDTGKPYRLTGNIAAIPSIPEALLAVWRHKLTEQPASKGTPIADGLPQRFADLIGCDDVLRKRWEGNTEGLADASRSGLDMSLTSLLVIRGFNDSQITAIHHSFKHGKVAQDGRDGDYLSDMIVKTRASRCLAGDKPMQTAYRLLAECYTDDDGAVLLRHWRGDLYRWTGYTYQPLEEADIKAMIYGYLNGGHVLSAKDKREPFHPKGRHVKEVLDALKAVIHVEHCFTMPCWLDPQADDLNPTELLAAANGLLHLPSKSLHEHSPRYFASVVLPFAYDLQAEPPMQWLHFLHDLWPDDMESIETLQEWCGYVLTADVSQQKILLLVGPPRAGKGVIARVLRALLGDANCAAPTLDSLRTNFGLQPLIGKSLAVVSDARLGSRVDQKVLAERLLSISGQDALTIDRKYQDPWTGTLGVRLMVLTNELPAIEDESGALASRFIVLQLTESWLGREDVGLANRLMQELPGILNWALRGLERLHARGYFRQPATAQSAMQELAELGSPIKVFLRESCILKSGAMVECGRLYSLWEMWCRANGREHPGTKQQFSKRVKSALPKITTSQHREDGDRSRYFEGICLKTEDDSPAFFDSYDRPNFTKGD